MNNCVLSYNCTSILFQPWKCPYCEYRSGLKGNIQLHCKKQHRDKQCTALQEFPMPKVKLNLRKVREL